MGWGVPRRPKVSNKLSLPNPREGSDGDIQVRQTGMGARIFAKLGGRWFSNILHGSDLDSPDVFIAKCWTQKITCPDDEGDVNSNIRIYLPNFINSGNFLNAMVKFQTNNNASYQQMLSQWYTGTRAPQIRASIVYYPVQNYIGIGHFSVPDSTNYDGNGGVFIDDDADPSDNGHIIALVFFK